MLLVISSAYLKHRHVDVQIDCRHKRRIIHCEQIKRNLIKIALKIRELLAIIYTRCLSRPVNVAVQNCWCDVINVAAVQKLLMSRCQNGASSKKHVLSACSICACFKRNKKCVLKLNTAEDWTRLFVVRTVEWFIANKLKEIWSKSDFLSQR